MERMAMSKVREILRLRWQLGRSVRETARSVGRSVGVVSKTTSRAQRAGLKWEEVEALDDTALDLRLFGGPKQSRRSGKTRPDPIKIDLDLRQRGVTLELLHLEYLSENPDGLRYTAFCEVYRRWKKKRRLSMRQTHKAGEKAFVDYSGLRPSIVDEQTGEARPVELFVAVLGASSYTFAEASYSQKIEDFVPSHARAFEYFGGAPAVVVPDNLKSAVTSVSRYEPTVARSYADLGRHYGTAIVPARPRKPKDKAKVEVAVQVAQRWILARLRHEVFYSLGALNERIRALCDELNARPRKMLGGRSRKELHETLDRPALQPLPNEAFELSEWKRAKVAPDYHVSVDSHFYSVPHELRGEEVEIRLTQTTMEVLLKNRRVAAHPRSRKQYGHTTDPGHMPEAHRRRFRAGDDLMDWARSVGPFTEALTSRIFERYVIPEQGWRSAMGLRRVGKKYGPQRLEAACERALSMGAQSYKPVERILKLGREQDEEAETKQSRTIEHENVRGAAYYH